MNLINYYESIFGLLSDKLNITPDQGDESFSDLYSLYPKINAITIDEIEEYINNAKSENLKLLFRELRFVKEYTIITEKNQKVLTLIKQTKKKKQEKEIESIKSNQDIQSIINCGEELLESKIHLFYVGIHMSLLYGMLNQMEDSIRIFNTLLDWYDTSKIMKKFVYRVMIDVYFANKVKIQNKLLRDNHNWLVNILYKLGKFSHYHQVLFRLLNFFIFTILWFVIEKKYYLCLYLCFCLMDFAC